MYVTTCPNCSLVLIPVNWINYIRTLPPFYLQSSAISHITQKYMNKTTKHIQVNPQRISLQRRLYEIFTVCFLTIMIPRNRKLVSLFEKSLNKSFKDNIQGRRHTFTLKCHILRISSRLQSLIFCG